jgi:hypothetical protein
MGNQNVKHAIYTISPISIYTIKWQIMIHFMNGEIKTNEELRMVFVSII